MARTTPRVEQEILVLPEGRNAAGVQVGSQQWFSWLADDRNASFFFTHEAGSFTARKERRKRGGWYWIAYRSQEGKLTKAYIGRNEDLTLERLREVTHQLTNQRKSSHNRTISLQSPAIIRLTPPPLSTPSSHMLERTELLEKLDASLHTRLTLVTAPAGFGKTTLLSRWYETRKQRYHNENAIAWIALDERDNDPIRFWSAVWSALRRGHESESIDISLALRSTPQMSIETILAVILNDGQHNILILDDYHTITNAQIHAGMEFLLIHLPSDMHIIISGRSEPPLSLGRARMYGELNELHADDLRLSRGEIERFLSGIVGITLSAEEQTMLEQRTEGWIAGLHLVGLTLRDQQKPGEVLARFTGSQRSLFDYFAEEVFARQSQSIQRFLLYTALLTEFTPQLCAALLDDEELDGSEARARDLLDAIERANVFIVPLDRQRGRYRYHALFSEFLREKLERSMPDHIAELQQRAARWYEQQGMLEEAIEYALAAQDTQQASRLIEHMGEDLLWGRGEFRRLLTWMQKLPATCKSENPHLEILYVWALLMSGQSDLEEVEALLETIESRDEENAINGLKGEILAIRARIAGFYNNTPQGIALAQQALQELPRERALLRADVAFGLSHTTRDLSQSYRMLAEALHISQALGSMRPAMFSSRYLASVSIEQGRLTEAEAILQQALHIAGATKSKRVPVTAIIHVGLAELLYERNELTDALRHAQLGLELGESSGEIKAVLSGHCILALILAARGELEPAWQQLWKAERIAAIAKVPWLSEQMAAIAIHLALLQNDIGGARRALQKMGLDAEQGLEQAPEPERVDERLMLARVWLAQEKYSAVIALLEPLASTAHQEKNIKLILSTQALLAIALSELRERQRAALLLGETLNMARPEGYTRLLLDIGDPMLELLQKIDVSGSARGYARKLLEISNRTDDENKNNVGLSEREYEVLRLVASGMSNQEIAEALIIEISTVKAHVRHLCQKLGVQKRTQAVAQARELGLL